jgi:hypothetical protein
MSFARTAVQDFSTANAIYANAIVTFYLVLSGAKTENLATIYSSLSGTDLSANPQTLDSYGKFRNPVYIQDAVIAVVTGLGNAPDHETGVIQAANIISGTGSPAGVVAAGVGTLYLRTDGGANTTLYVKEIGTDFNGWAAK